MTPPPTGAGDGAGQDRFADDAHRYQLSSRIATGGMGEVWRARDTVLSRPVAVKVLKPEYADDAMFRTRFETEARHAASLHHPGIAGVFDFGEASPTPGSRSPRPFLVMELVEGEPLSHLLRPGAPMDPEVVRDLLSQAAAALGVAHAAGIVHRDVKPGNLIVTPDRRVKVTDFGIARAAEGMSLTETGQVMGTPAYISPEQAEGRRATAASDVYALGVIAYECLAGRKPFAGETPVAIAVAHVREPVPGLPDAIPADLAAVVRRSMAKDPSERYADGAAFAAALRDPATAATTVLPPAPAAEPTRTQVLPAAAGPPVPPPVPASPAAAQPDRERRGLPGWLPWAILAVVLLVGGVLLAQALGDDGTPTDQPTPQQSTTQSPTQESSTPSPTQPTESSQSSQSTQTPQETTSSPSPTTEAPPETVTVDPAAYVGRDVKDVEKELRDLGLEVTTQELDNPGDQPEGIVTSVDPNGEVPVGDTVVVTSYGKVPGPSDGQGNSQGRAMSDGKGGGRG